LIHWLAWVWAAMWPNIFAPGFWTILGIGLSHWRLRTHQERKHAEIMHHIKKGSQQ
jgi:hypothetical protein